jgi:branched-chain amino acid transport system substrate-binding protein
MAALRLRLAVYALILFTRGLALAHAEATPGVTATEISLGSILDLSGPMAPYGVQVKHGMQLRVAEINREGGVNGRMLKLDIEDSASDDRLAVLALERLIDHDQIFALLATVGAPANRGVIPVLLKRNVISFLPIASSRATYDPPDRLKVAFMLSASEQLRTALPYLFSRHRYSRICSVVEDGDFGNEVMHATDSAARSEGAASEHVEFAHGAADFPAIAAKLRGSSCELVVFGSTVADAVGVITESRRIGVAADFVGTATLYSNLMHQLGGKAVEGVYAVNTVSQPYPDDASKLVRDWTATYRSKFAEEPSVYAVYGWVIVDLFAKAAARAGPVLSVSSFNAALENSTFPRDMFGSPEFHVTAADRIGSHKVRVSQIANGKWVAISTLLDAPQP